MVPSAEVGSAEYRQMHSVFALLRTTVPQRILVAADTPRTAMLGVAVLLAGLPVYGPRAGSHASKNRRFRKGCNLCRRIKATTRRFLKSQMAGQSRSPP